MISAGNAARLARPYARAAFDYAREHQQLAQWSEMLRTLSEWVQQPTVASLLSNPQYSTEKRAEIVLALGEKVLSKEGGNFIKLLASYQRLSVLPEIYTLFEQLRAEVEKTLQVQVKSAVPLDEKNKTQLVVSLTKKLGQPVELACDVDAALLGGFLVSVGDRVIDSSIRGQLEKLRHAVVV
jgi:F-type H+-transporting ATPase subunit delta